jgi:RimJ/RimL family protein N-acetyltransferase
MTPLSIDESGAPGGGHRPGAPLARERRAAVFAGEQPILRAVTASGEEIRLRRPDVRDIDAIVATCRDAATARWTTVPQPYQRSDAEFFVGEHTRDRWTRGEGAVFAIVNGSDTYVGSMELRLSPVDESVADVGFMTAPHVRGRGYVPAALDAVCIWGFQALGLVRIEWRAEVGNTASRRAAEKAGFVFEGTARSVLTRRDGTRADAWIAARLATDSPAGVPVRQRER